MGKIKDLTGMRFGSWTVLGLSEQSSRSGLKWDCRCDCGKVKSVIGKNLKRGLTKSCGCVALQKVIERSSTHGMSNTRLYQIWENMRKRCNNPNDPRFHRYGGRGITVCDAWNQSFEQFYEWSVSHGYEDNLTIDRIDNDGNYTPENCRWVSIKEQCRNRVTNVRITINGETKIMTEWCELYGLDRDCVSARIKSGWDKEKAILTPTIRCRKVVVFQTDGTETKYDSVRSASTALGVSRSSVEMACNGTHKTCRGLKMKYKQIS